MTDYAKHIALANTPASNMREYANMPTITWQNEKQR